MGQALAHNSTLRTLKVSENDLKSEGAIPIIQNAQHLEQLTLSKNYLKSDCGKHIQTLLKKSKSLKKLSLDFNELSFAGIKCVASGLAKNTSLESLNLKGNVIGDQGIVVLAQALAATKAPLRELDISLNEVGPIGF